MSYRDRNKGPLRATRTAAESLAKRQLADTIAALRAILTADHNRRAGDLRKLLTDAERKLFAGETGEANALVGRIEQGLKDLEEAAAVQAGLRESETLASARGVETEQAQSGVSSRDGWAWLVTKGRLTPTRRQAGEHYRELFARARSDGTRSCLNDDGPTGGDGVGDGRARAMLGLRTARRHVLASVGQDQGERLLTLLNAICGEGHTTRELASGDGHESRVVEANLMTALDMMAVHFGMIRIAA